MLNLKQLSQQEQEEGPQSVMVYGPPKSGKTWLVSQLVKKYNLIWIDVEKGYQTLFSSVPEEFQENINLILVRDTQEIPNAIRTVGHLFCENRTQKVCLEHGVVSCTECTRNKAETQEINLYDLGREHIVVVDSLTQLSDSALAHALGKVGIFDKKKAEYDHWDRQGLLLKNILTAMQRLPCHVVMISHEEELEQEDGTKKVSPTAGTRNFSRKVGRYFDHLIYCEIKNKAHRQLSASTASLKIQSGSRNNIELENGDDILELFKPKKKSAEDDKGSKPNLGGSASSSSALLAKIKKK